MLIKEQSDYLGIGNFFEFPKIRSVPWLTVIISETNGSYFVCIPMVMGSTLKKHTL